ncbi:baseplate assembly protein [Izhakiella australiensis]|uniref:Baseplate assembly protein n=1 Tax=Izhakiella australiensis TaxID=1926881 RepID=A0A1S8YLM1_9GAMM|nr:GPW/gp25 family protein [Izhakiella australiensis]OON39778.1 baseplate assembly protein [Izhakiella australiensis]
MNGTDRRTGKPLSGPAHLRQSVCDILTTPVGSRVLARDYGSKLLELIDNPRDGITRLRIIAATASALANWEPRLKLERVQVLFPEGADQRCVITIQAQDKENDQAVQLEGINIYGNKQRN